MKRKISPELIMQLDQFTEAEDPVFCLSSSLIKLSLFLITENFLLLLLPFLFFPQWVTCSLGCRADLIVKFIE